MMPEYGVPQYGTIVDALLSYLDGRRPSAAKAVFVTQRGSEAGTREMTWQQLATSGQRAASGLSQAGVQPGDVVLLALPTGEDCLVALIACLFVGALPCIVPVDSGVIGRAQIFSHHVRAAAARFQPRALVVRTPVLTRLIEDGDCIAPLMVAVESLSQGAKDVQSAVRVPVPADLSHIQLTSGSTATPKAVALSHAAVVSNITRFEQNGGLDQEHVSGLHWLPLYHDMGLIALLGAIYSNRDMVLMASEDFIISPMSWLQMLSRFRSTISGAPNFALAYCVRRFRADLLPGVDLSHLQTLVVGAEQIHHSTLQQFSETFGPYGFNSDAYMPCYGMAEATLAVTMPRSRISQGLGVRTRWHTPKPSAASGAIMPGEAIIGLGQPLAGTKIEIRGIDGVVLASDAIGEVFVSSPSLMEGYFMDDDSTRRVVNNGFYATGDSGYLHADELYILGRIKELVILRGRNYPPHDFEHCVATTGKVDIDRVAAFGVPDPASGSEKLVLVIEPEHYGVLGGLREEIQKRLRERFNFGADDICFVPKGSIPRTTSRKIRRTHCAQLYRQSELRSYSDNDVPPHHLPHG